MKMKKLVTLMLAVTMWPRRFSGCSGSVKDSGSTETRSPRTQRDRCRNRRLRRTGRGRADEGRCPHISTKKWGRLGHADRRGYLLALTKFWLIEKECRGYRRRRRPLYAPAKGLRDYFRDQLWLHGDGGTHVPQIP